MESIRADRPARPTAGEEEASRALRDRVVISLRPVGTPVALGLFGLCAASLPLSGLQLGWMPVQQGPQVALVLVGFAFVAQLLAAVFALLARDGTVGTAMGTLALTWLVVGLTLFVSSPGATSGALGLFLIFSGLAMAMVALTAALAKLVPAAVFLVAALRFLATAVYELSGVAGWERVAGLIGLVLFLLAMYAAWAAMLEGAVGRTILPMGRLAEGRIAVNGGLFEQVRRVTNEPGVREQL